MLVAASELLEQLEDAVLSWLPARSLTERAIEKGQAVFPSGQVLVLDTYAPWKDHLHELEERRGVQGRALYVLFPDARCTWCVSHSSAARAVEPTRLAPLPPPHPTLPHTTPPPPNRRRIVAVPVEPDSFVSRKPLPKAWRGLRDEELSKLLGLPGCVFVRACS